MNNRKLARAVNLLVVFSMLLNALAPAIPVLAQPLPRAQAEADFAPVEAKAEAPNRTVPVAGNFAPPVFRDPQAPEDTLTPTPTPTGINTEPASPTFTITETPTPLPSDTETPEPSASDTPSPTSTVTETETSTPTGTATGSETPTATFTPTPVVGVDLSLSAKPAMVKKDGSLTIEWRVKGIEIESRPDPRFVLKITVPQGFAFAPRALAMAAEMGLEGAVFDPQTGVLTIQLRAAEGRIEWRVDDAVTGPYDIRAELIDRDAAALSVAAAVLTVQDGRYDKMGRGGGVVRSGDDRVRVEFGGQTADGDVRLRIKPLDYREGGIRPLGGHAFEVLAVDDAFFGQFEKQPSADSRKPDREKDNRRPDFLHQFRREFTIEVRYSEVGLGGDEAGLILYYYNEQLGIWLPLPTTVDVENNILHARTNHLTVFDYKAQNFEAARLPDMKAWQVTSFTGAASYSLPLWTPPGPGGLQPSLSLSYNSQSVDSASSASQASWVGMGWNLDAGGTIIRDTHGTLDYTGDDSFSLSVAGVGGMLLPGADGYMHTADETFWRIQYNEADDSWTAWDKTGNVYTFATRAKTPLYSGCSAPTLRTWQWSLTSMKNIYGKQLTYAYTTESKTVKDSCGGNSSTLDLAVVPLSVTYPHNLYQVQFFTAGDRQDYRYEWTQDVSRTPYKKNRLSEVRIMQDSNKDGVFETLMRRYIFSYESDPAKRIFPGVEWPYNCGSSGCSLYMGMLTLTKVQEFGTDGTTGLPAATFEYENGRLKAAENGYGGRVVFTYDAWNDNVGAAPMEMRCEAVNPDVDDHTNFDGWTNGLCDNQSADGRFYIYGGQNLSVNTALVNNFSPGTVYRIEAVALGAGSGASLAVGYNDGNNTYYSDPATNLPVGGAPQTITYDFTLANDAKRLHLYLSGSNWALVNLKITPLLTRYRVTQKLLIDGIDTTPNESYTYQYVGAASNDAAHSDDAANNPRATSYNLARGEFRGHSRVTEIGPNGSRSVTVYSQADDVSGRVLESWVEDLTGKIFTRSFTDYAVRSETTAEIFSRLPNHSGVNAALAEPSLGANSAHYMFPRKQDGTVYTDLARVWVVALSEESRTCVATDPTCNSQYAATKREYLYGAADQGGVQYGNQTKVVESYWNGSAFIPTRWTRNRYFTNQNTSIYLTGLIGVSVTRSCTTSACDNLDAASLISQTINQYDGGGSTTPPTAGRLTVRRSLVDYDGSQVHYADTRFTYDDWGNSITSTTFTGTGTSSMLASAGARTSSTTYDSDFHTYALVSTNALGQSTTLTYDYTLAAPRTQTDSNGAVTTVYYDVLGRLIRVDRPGDTYFLMVSYYDTARPYWMAVSQKIDADRRYEVRKIYDGLGRLIETQNAHATVDGADVDIISYTKWINNSNGSQTWQSIPYVVAPWNGAGNPYREPNLNLPKSRTVSDVLGRTVETYGIDGQKASETEYNYGYSAADFGPLTRTFDAKDRPTVSISDAWGRTAQVIPVTGPDILYTYNEAGQLIAVFTGGNTTTITYDTAGRKISMNDPDMGDWEYKYDALGNLEQQTDPRGCTTSMYYDKLNRLTQKLFTGMLAECSATPSITYSFDSTADGNAGIGRRTGMTDGSGSAAWKFDLRGRLVAERKMILGGGSYTTGYGYNAADLPIYTIYPGGSNNEPGERVDQAYNSQMTLDSVRSNTYNFTYVQSIAYDATGRIARRVLGQDSANSKAIENTFTYYDWTTPDMGGKLQRALYVGNFNGNPAVLLQDLRYNYDETGNVLTIADYASEPGMVQTQTYTYDGLDRLLTANVAGGLNGLYDEAYTYSPSTGNLESKGGVDYTYGNPAHVHAVTGLSNGDTFTYDAAGNQVIRVVGGDTFALTYDAEGRLIRVLKNGALQAEYLYDGEGKLVRTVEDGKTTIIISGLAELELGGTPAATAVPSATYTPSSTFTPSATNTLTRTSTPSASATPTRSRTPILPGIGTGLTGEYFAANNFSNRKLVRIDSKLEFNWGTGSPDTSIPADNFSVRWTGYVMPRFSETYTFITNMDDRVMVWINDALVVNGWGGAGEFSGAYSVPMTAGQKYKIRIDYYEISSGASAKLSWSSPSQPREVIPQNQLFPNDMPDSFTNDWYGANRNNYTGWVGYAFTPSEDIVITALGRLMGSAFNQNHDVRIWKADDMTLVAGATIQPSSTWDYVGYRFVRLAAPVVLKRGVTYRIASQETAGGDNFKDLGSISNHKSWAVVNGSCYGASSPTTCTTTADTGYVGPMFYGVPAGYGTPTGTPSGTPTSLPTGIPTSTPAPVSGLTGEYFTTRDASGNPYGRALIRTDANIYFNWTDGSPDLSLIPREGFSVRWTGWIIPKYSEAYTFTTDADDGVRLWINNQQIINRWTNGYAVNPSTPIMLSAGQKYSIRMEYYEATGNARALLYWSSSHQPQEVVPSSQLQTNPISVPPSGNGSGLTGEYFTTRDSSGSPYGRALVRTDPLIYFNWTDSSPDLSLIPRNGFAARWTGKILPKYSEVYKFLTDADDGVRLWVNDQPVINRWTNGAAVDSGTILLNAGQYYDIKLEYYEYDGNARALLYWSSASQVQEVVPTSQLYPSGITVPANGNGTGLMGNYFANMTLSGSPALARLDSIVEFNWTDGSPNLSSIPRENFSARWTGFLLPKYSETYLFWADVDDGARLRINNQLVFERWNNAGSDSGYFTLQAGQKYSIQLEYYENTGNAKVRLHWMSASQRLEIIPQTQLFPDNPAPTATFTATPTGSVVFPGKAWKASAGFTSIQGVNQWYYQEWNGSAYVNMVWDSVNSWWKGSTATSLAVAAGWQHPSNYDSVRKWLAPAGIGQIRITGTVSDGGVGCGDGVKARILQNGTQIWPASGWQTIAEGNTTGYAHDIAVTAAGGDAIYFIVNQNANNSCDTTNWDPTITAVSVAGPTGTPIPTGLVPAQSWLASAGFSSTQGLNQWFYQEWNGAAYSNIAWDSVGAFWKGSTADILAIAAGWMHPSNYDAVRKWVAPAGVSVVRITGTVSDGDSGGGDGVQVKILKNGAQIWPASGWQAIANGNTTGVSHDVTVSVAAGDAIYFVVNRVANNFYDTTLWNPTVASMVSPTATTSPTATAVAPVPAGQTWTFYYYAGGQRIAMRKVTSGGTPTNTLQYILGDHLGSTSVIADVMGQRGPEVRYKAFGETRYASGGGLGTKYQYTGQRNDSYIKLYKMGARWYDPAIGRFTQPDTIVPDPEDPSDYEKYSYVKNNPMRYTDPTGHIAQKDCWDGSIAINGKCPAWGTASGDYYGNYYGNYKSEERKEEAKGRLVRDWLLNNRDGNGDNADCTGAGADVCTCDASDAIDAAGGDTYIPPDQTPIPSNPYINANAFRDYISAQGGRRLGLWEFYKYRPFPYEGSVSNNPGWEDFEKKMALSVRPGDIVFYSDERNWDRGVLSHVAIVAGVENGNIWVVDSRDGGRPHLIDDQLGNPQIGTVDIWRPNY